jgi:hypothetical protein
MNTTPTFGEDVTDDDLHLSSGSCAMFIDDDNELVVIEEGEHHVVIHDQLPSVEEIKFNLSPHNHKISKKMFLKISLAVVVFLAVIVPISVLASKNTTSSRTVNTEPEGHADRILNFLFENKITSEPRLLDKNSPQHFALQFLATDITQDGGYVNLDLLSNEAYAQKFVERYALAVLFYHFKGSHWTYKLNFLTSTDHCTWFTYFDTAAGDLVKEGVSCDQEGRVAEIILRK